MNLACDCVSRRFFSYSRYLLNFRNISLYSFLDVTVDYDSFNVAWYEVKDYETESDDGEVDDVPLKPG